jgi:hypothetical protein
MSSKKKSAPRGVKVLGLEKARRAGFKAGVEAAAEIADSFNALMSHPYRLGDVLLAKLNQTRRQRPRRNVKALSAISMEEGRTILRRIPITDADCETMASRMEPEAWVEYELGQGVCTNSAFWKCAASYNAAQQLLAAGYRCCAVQGKVASALDIVKALRPKDKVQQAFLTNLIKATERKVRADRKARATA